MRWLIDQGLPKVLVAWLAERGDDVFDVAPSSLSGKPDDVLWLAAGQQKRIVVTRDLGFMLPLVVPPPAGVILVRAPDTFRADQILRLFQDGLGRVSAASLLGSVTVIQPGRVRQRPLERAGRRKPRREAQRRRRGPATP